MEPQLYNGNAFDILPDLDTANMVVVTDPPYGIRLKNHGRNSNDYSVIGDDDSFAGDWVCNFCNQHKLPLVIFASPWKPWAGSPRNMIVWDKGGFRGGGGDTKRCLKRTWELIQTFRTGIMNGPRDGSVWRHPITTTKHHLCEKPVNLMERLILRFTSVNDVICDPFMGSGSTGVACTNLGRKFIGIECDPAYYKICTERLSG